MDSFLAGPLEADVRFLGIRISRSQTGPDGDSWRGFLEKCHCPPRTSAQRTREVPICQYGVIGDLAFARKSTAPGHGYSLEGS